MKRVLGMLLVCLAISAAMGQEACPAPKTVKTTGTAEIKVTPDEVVIQIGVERQSSKARVAKIAVADTSRKILAALKALGVEDKDVQTEYLYLQPMLDYRNGVHISNFTAEQTLSVKLRDISKLDDAMDAVVSAGVNRIDGVEYQSSELRKYRDQARDEAVKAAREKATALANGLGNQIGKTYSIDETEQSQNAYPMFGGLVPNVRLDKARAQGPSTAPGQLTVTASVTVAFELL